MDTEAARAGCCTVPMHSMLASQRLHGLDTALQQHTFGAESTCSACPHSLAMRAHQKAVLWSLLISVSLACQT